jgi:hypothetical protein
MNKNWVKKFMDSLDFGRFIFNIYSSILIGLLIFPFILCILLGLEWLLFS